MPRVTFTGFGVEVEAEPGERLLDVARRAGAPIPAPCNGRGICGRCAVRVVEGALAEPEAEEVRILQRAGGDIRLACRARIGSGDVSVGQLGRPKVPVWPASESRDDYGTVRRFRVAVDFGTTTIAAAVIDRDSVVAVGSAPNRQAAWGADVLSRLQEAGSSTQALTRMRDEGYRSVAEAVEVALRNVGDVEPAVAGSLVVAANVPNMALFTGDDGGSLLVPPYTLDAIPLSFVGRGSIERAFAGTVLPQLFPQLESIELVEAFGGFVGGDARAAAMTTFSSAASAPELLVDLGTNAEILLHMGDRLLCASAAGGPTFEGGGVSSGGPAVEGAIVAVDFTDGGIVTTPESPTVPWLTGSGLISAIAGMLRVGILDASGRLLRIDSLGDRYSVNERGVLGFEIARVGETSIVIDQFDVRAVQSAKAAVAAGISRVLDAAGVGDCDLSAIHIAGAFGAALRTDDLVALGVVPFIALASIGSVGNAALRGATMLALDAETAVPWQQEESITLSGDEAFSDAFLRNLDLRPTFCAL